MVYVATIMAAPYAFVQTFMRRYMQSDLLYRYLRRVLITAQYVLRRADEPELKAFSILREDGDKGLLIDIGANAGQTAVAFGFICRDFDILSFEPNPALWSELEFARKILGARFSYKPCGIGDQKGSYDLHVPYVGNLPVTTQASVVADKVERAVDELKRTLGQDVEVRQVKVEIVRLDDLSLAPNGIKIDVEGHEYAVLQGMTKTIATHKPLLMFEKNTKDAECQELLAGPGYCFYQFDPSQQHYTTAPVEGMGMRNWFGVPERLQQRFKERLAVAPEVAPLV